MTLSLFVNNNFYALLTMIQTNFNASIYYDNYKFSELTYLGVLADKS